MLRPRHALAALAPLALLAACSGSEPEPAPADTNAVDPGPVVPNALDAPLVEATPLPTPTATPTEEAPPVPDEAQVQDDADATGMTARVSRDEAADEPVRPAESEEKR